MMHVIFGPWTPQNVAVLEMLEGEWQVRDLTCRSEDHMPVIGFIEQTSLGYEAIDRYVPTVRHVFDRLDSAVGCLVSDRKPPQEPSRRPVEPDHSLSDLDPSGIDAQVPM